MIKKARNDTKYFQSDIQLMRSRQVFIRSLLGNEVESSFKKTIQACKRSILVSIDGFDSKQSLSREKRFMSVRQTTAEEKSKFETLWLTSLLMLLNDVTTIQEGNPLYGNIKLCLLVPFDRYLEATAHKRDAFVYSGKVCSSNWSGVELAEMFRKRLEVISDSFADSVKGKKTTYNIHMNTVLKKGFSYLPQDIEIRTNDNKTAKIPLFLYILRFSFWRPRDILKALEELLCKSYLLNKDRIKIDSNFAKELIRKAAEKIVVTDCLNEFQHLWVNIKAAMECFRGKNVVLPYDKFCELVTSPKFSIQLSNGDEKKEIADIILFLYELGFVGILASQEYQKNLRLYRSQNFVFYSGMKPMSDLSTDEFQNNSIILNPIFVPYYKLIVDTNEILGIDCWETLNYYDSIKNFDYIVDFKISGSPLF